MKRVPLNTTVDEALLKEWKQVANEEGRDLNWYIEQFIGNFLQVRRKNNAGSSGNAGIWPFMAPPRR
jgi:hypothetical protein